MPFFLNKELVAGVEDEGETNKDLTSLFVMFICLQWGRWGFVLQQGASCNTLQVSIGKHISSSSSIFSVATK